MPDKPPVVYTQRFKGIVNVLISECRIGKFVHSDHQHLVRPNDVQKKAYLGIWDTGATNTCITRRVADECNLETTGVANQITASGQETVDVFLASFFFYNIAIPVLPVTEAKLVGGNADVLIGMDVIGRGDFSISNFEGQTYFSFRTPSCRHADFSEESQI